MSTHEYSSIYDKIFTECKGTFHRETKTKAMFLYDLKEFPVKFGYFYLDQKVTI